jgi:hypothetical protein
MVVARKIPRKTEEKLQQERLSKASELKLRGREASGSFKGPSQSRKDGSSSRRLVGPPPPLLPVTPERRQRSSLLSSSTSELTVASLSQSISALHRNLLQHQICHHQLGSPGYVREYQEYCPTCSAASQ